MVFTGRKVSLYFNTLRHLKLRQLIWQFIYLRKRNARHGEVSEVVSRCIRLDIRFLEKSTSITADGFFSKLGICHTVHSSDVWDKPDFYFLWKYNLHYFDYINSRKTIGVYEKIALIKRWIEEHRAGIGWDPYPTSLRVVNWIKFDLENDVFDCAVRKSLLTQVLHLEQNIEWHIDANHLFSNAKALLFASVYFANTRVSGRWGTIAHRILTEVGREHFYSDGGHYERSPMYHLIILEDLLDILNLCHSSRRTRDSLLLKYSTLARDCLTWAKSMSSNCTDFPLFGDSSLGIAPSLSDLVSYAAGMRIFPEEVKPILMPSGFFNIRLDSDANVFGTFGGPSPDHQPGHSHADIQCFELYSKGRCLITDSGIPTYAATNERLRTRRSSAHNVVTVDNDDSSEVWSSFRVARRVKVCFCDAIDGPSTSTVISVISPYSKPWLRQGREWIFFKNARKFTVKDYIEGLRGSEEINFLLHAGPGLMWILSDSHGSLSTGSKIIARVSLSHLLSYSLGYKTIYREFNTPVTVNVLVAARKMRESGRITFLHDFYLCG